MPNPTKGETREDYIGRFMASPEALKDFPDDKQRAAVAYSKWKEIHNGDDPDEDIREEIKKSMSEPAKPRHNAAGQRADIIRTRFIEPGLVHYNDVGTVLVSKPALDQFAGTFVGRPVFNERHRDTTSKDFSAGRADGVVSRVWYEPSDGWYWAEAAIWDADTKENCRNGYSVSCAYDVSRWSDKGGIHNNIPYEREVLDGEYTHLAIVANPRYEGARILYNSQGGSMKIAFWKKDKPEVRNASEVETDTATLEADGKEVPLKEAIDLWNAAQEKEKKALENLKLSDDDEVEIGGERVTVKNLKNAWLANRKNDEDDKEKKDKEKMENGDLKKGECPKCEGSGDIDGKKCGKCDGTGTYYTAGNADEDDEKEKEKERKNAESKKKEEEEEMERKNARESRDRLRNAAIERNGTFEAPMLMTREDRVKEGASRYGSSK